MASCSSQLNIDGKHPGVYADYMFLLCHLGEFQSLEQASYHSQSQEPLVLNHETSSAYISGEFLLRATQEGHVGVPSEVSEGFRRSQGAQATPKKG